MTQQNPKDPLPKSVSEQTRHLFERMNNEAAKGFTAAQVQDATLNILVNSIRQAYANGPQAEARFNEIMGRTKSLLLEHYDGVTGKRKNVFPFTQYIRPPLVEADDDFKH
jgi:hypothetical protein